MARQANELKAGFLVVVTLLLLFLTVIMVSPFNPWGEKQNIYKIRFTYIGGLSEGSPVRFGGRDAGHVVGIDVVSTRETMIEVEVSVDAGLPVKRDSTAAITSLGLLGDNYVEIDLGSAGAELLPNGEYLAQKQFPSLPELFAGVDATMVDARKLIQTLDSQISRISEKADVLLGDMDKTFNDQNQKRLTSILTETDTMIKEASPKVNDTLTHINAATAKLVPLMDSFNAAIKELEELFSDVDTMVVENRPGIQKILQDLDKTLLEARATIMEVRAVLQYNRGNLDILIENLAASSDNIREFTDTIKQHPFSLIRMPSKKPRIPPELPK